MPPCPDRTRPLTSLGGDPYRSRPPRTPSPTHVVQTTSTSTWPKVGSVGWCHSAQERREYEVNTFPVQAAKVQPPPLREDILARDRLLDWLHAKIHQRLVLVLAEAGYGKTTLLADFAARTRLRTLWYRLDEDDRDWVTVMHHLVAAGREHDPDFAPRTAGLLADTRRRGAGPGRSPGRLPSRASRNR